MTNLDNILKKKNRKKLEKFVFKNGESYWEPSKIEKIYTKSNIFPKSYIPFKNKFEKVKIPNKFLKFKHQKIDYIYVEKNSIVNLSKTNKENTFYNVDWVRLAFVYLSCFQEADYELKNKPIHSYSYKIDIKFDNFYDYAWVNRIFLILRSFFAYQNNLEENTLFGNRPISKIYITHDVDILEKKIQTRIKGSLIEMINLFRFKFSLKQIKKSINFLFNNCNYFNSYLDMMRLEKKYKKKPIFFINPGRVNNNLISILLEPTYKSNDHLLINLIKRIKKYKFDIGLHPSYFSWNNSKILFKQKEAIEKEFKITISKSRQHWLKFSIFHTWKILSETGIQTDYTLGFNDRYGFRNGSSLKIKTWNFFENNSNNIHIIPTIIMDSQLFHYKKLNSDERKKIIDRLIDEVQNVGGEASILWHPHTLSKDYDWGKEFYYIIKKINN